MPHHYELVNGENRSDGYLRVRKNLVEAGKTFKDLYQGDAAVRDAFTANFSRRHELGGACCVYYRGEGVVDI